MRTRRKTVLLLGMVGILTGIQGVTLADTGEKPARVVVPMIQVSGVDETAAELLTDILLDVLFNRHGITALGPSEIRQMLGLEAQKQLLGCAEGACLTEIGGALEAQYFISGRIGKLGSLNVLTLLLFDTQKAELAGRATMKLAKLEDAMDAIGPLTDKLLGRTFRAARASEIAAFRSRDEAPPDHDPLTVRDFCKRYDAYRVALEKKPYDTAHPKAREALLLDLILTPHKPRYDDKLSCIKRSQGYIAPRVVGVLRGAKTEDEALDLRRRLAEARQFGQDLEVVEDAYAMGLEKVKLNTGTLPIKLPFGVKPAKVVQADDTEEVAAYVRAYARGSKLVARALTLAKAGAPGKFERLFLDPKKGTSPRYTFDSLVKSIANGDTHDPCPLFVLSIDDVERNAARLAEKGELKVCLRKQQRSSAYLHTLTLKKQGKTWKVDHW